MAIHCVVPTLNAAATLEETLHSLHAQRNVSLQLIVIDSGSNDATPAICQQMAVSMDYAAPGNMYRAINAGLRHASAEWLTYLNADDTLYPDSYARLIALGDTTQADVVYGNCEYVDKRGRLIYAFAAARPEQLLPLFRMKRMGFAQPAAIFRRHILEKLAGFDENYRYKADADFFIRALIAGARFARLPGRAVARFRLHAAQLSHRQSEAIAVEGDRLFDQFQPTRHDHWVLRAWQMRNVPHYLERIVRASWLAKRLRLPRAIEAYDYP